MKTFDKLPEHKPKLELLDHINFPKDFRGFSVNKLEQLADELREYLLYSVSQSGGHFGANLGVVELTIALHYLYNTPYDRIVWDVGHQTYPHKILTGRKNELPNIRHKDGLSGFPKRTESEYDAFGVGHSSTSISAALGMAVANKMKGEHRKSIAIIGDGAMTGGMAFEAMNHAADTNADIMVILNDNNMSISRNVGGLANYFSRLWSSKLHNSVMPKALRETANDDVSANFLFKAMGFHYAGPIDGHDIHTLITHIEKIKGLSGPKLLHVYTSKGKGFLPAEKDPIKYHALGKIEPNQPTEIQEQSHSKPVKFQDVFGTWLCDVAKNDKQLVAITPAMCEGSGMVKFAKRFPKQFHDVAIAEQHAITFAAGLACEQQIKPVVAIYSTFLQRGYDQLVHDVCLQNLDILFAIDRAGIVGEDGATHAGLYDIAFMRCLPNIILMAPSDENECRQMLWTGYQHKGAAAVRYPRGTGIGADQNQTLKPLEIGKAIIRRKGQKYCIFAFGTLVHEAIKAAEDINATVIDMRFIKPIDEAMIVQCAQEHDYLISIEDHAIEGGANSAITEVLHNNQCKNPFLALGISNEVVQHGSRNEVLAQYYLNSEGIKHKINLLFTK